MNFDDDPFPPFQIQPTTGSAACQVPLVERTYDTRSSAVIDHPHIDELITKGKEVIARLTATEPRGTAEEVMQLGTLCIRLEEAFMAGVRAADEARKAEELAIKAQAMSAATVATWTKT